MTQPPEPQPMTLRRAISFCVERARHEKAKGIFKLEFAGASNPDSDGHFRREAEYEGIAAFLRSLPQERVTPPDVTATIALEALARRQGDHDLRHARYGPPLMGDCKHVCTESRDLALIRAALSGFPLVSVSPSEEAVAAIRKTLEGFDKQIFVRNIEGDTAPDWAIKAFPYIRALGVLAAQFGSSAPPKEGANND